MKRILMDNKLKEHVYRIGTALIILMFIVLIFSIIRSSFSGQVDNEQHIYFEIVLLLLLAVLAEAAVFYFKQQSVVILMILGILISPSFIQVTWEFLRESTLPLHLAETPPEVFYHPEIINIFAQLGAIILLFKVGLHSKIEKIFSITNLLVAFIGITVPFGVGYFYAILTGGNFVFSLFIGVVFAATSVGVTVAILKDLKVLNKEFSEVIIGAAVIDDILALLLLSLVTNFVEAGDGGTLSLFITLITAFVFILGTILIGKYIIKYIDRKELGAKRLLISLAFMLFMAYVAEVIRLSAIVGAFLAGVILNKSKNYQIIEERTYGLELLFMPIFFISLGTLVDVNSIIIYLWPIVIITLLAILSKLVGCGLPAMLKLSKKDSLLVGLGMIPRGEVALIIASIALTKGIIPQSEYSILSTMALMTSFLTPPILSYYVKKFYVKKF